MRIIKKYEKPKLFKPSQKDLERVGNIISENLSDQKVVVAGDKKIRGKVGIGKTKTIEDELKENIQNRIDDVKDGTAKTFTSEQVLNNIIRKKEKNS